MLLKKYSEFINEEKEDDGTDHYFDNQFAKLEEEMKGYKKNKYKLDALIKTYDYSDMADRNLNKIIDSNSLLIQHWSILKKNKRVADLIERNDELKKEINEIEQDGTSLEAREAYKLAVEKKQDKIDSNLEEINKIEKEAKELDKELEETEKETIRKITDLKKKLVN